MRSSAHLLLQLSNRHCPKCQSLARAQWLDDRRAELLATQYFHVVLTLPEAIANIAYQNKAVVYGILFRAASETLRTIAADPKHLGAEIGFFAVLHTWGQNLLHHPHLHCVVTGGGLRAGWQPLDRLSAGLLLPVRVLSRFFRRLFLTYLQKAFDAGKLRFFASRHPCGNTARSAAISLRYGRPPGSSTPSRPSPDPSRSSSTSARYTHRVAISNNRLRDIDDGNVRFTWKDYRHHDQPKIMTLSADEFIRRFLLHVLPKGFHHIRYYGLLGNRHRAEKLACCRRLLGMTLSEPAHGQDQQDYRAHHEELTGDPLTQCPVCHQGR